MDIRLSLIHMLKGLREEMLAIQQQGAGYYSCTPMARRYNRLLEQARHLFPETDGLIGTFDALEEADPKDPADKMKIVQGIRLEIGQLLTLLESATEQKQ